MAQAIWPMVWPEGALPEDADPAVVDRCERLAATSMRQLTLYRVGGTPITVMPCTTGCRNPMTRTFHPVLLDRGIINCWCGGGCDCQYRPTVFLEAPVGSIEQVMVDGEILDPSAYRVENGNRLVRLDGKLWPSCAGDSFTVTYLNAYPVDSLGQWAGGLLAAEFYKNATNAKGCRLPSSVTRVQREGISMEIATGMWPDMQTGINEVDTYLNQWNPNNLRSRPGVYSPDRNKHRQVTWP